MKPVIYDTAAKVEVDDAIAVSPNPTRFRAAIDAAIAQISAHPQQATRIGKSNLRQYDLMRFPYSVVYEDDTTVIRVVAFAHHKRRPGYWKRRLHRN